MGNVCKRSGVYKGRLSLDRLKKVRPQGVFEEYGSRPGDTEVLRAYRGSVLRGCNDHPSDSFPQIAKVRCERENGHQLTCNGDLVAGLPYDTV